QSVSIVSSDPSGSCASPVLSQYNPTSGNLFYCNAGVWSIQGTNSIGMGEFSLNSLPFSATPAFDASKGSIQSITLRGNITSSTFTNALTGQLVTMHICQDATGGRTFKWPANFHGGMTIG